MFIYLSKSIVSIKQKLADIITSGKQAAVITVSARQDVCQSAAESHARCHRSVAPTTTSRVQAWKIMHRPDLHLETDTGKK